MLPRHFYTSWAVHAATFAYTGDSEADQVQLLSHALNAHQVQDEVAEVAAAASDWMRQHASSGHQRRFNDSSSLDYRGLCRLCLIPTELVQLPTLQLQHDLHCLVSAVLTAVQGLWLCSISVLFSLGCGSMLMSFACTHQTWQDSMRQMTHTLGLDSVLVVVLVEGCLCAVFWQYFTLVLM